MQFAINNTQAIELTKPSFPYLLYDAIPKITSYLMLMDDLCFITPIMHSKWDKINISNFSLHILSLSVSLTLLSILFQYLTPKDSIPSKSLLLREWLLQHRNGAFKSLQ